MRRVLDKFRRGLSCEEVLEVLQGYLDGEVDEDTARKVAEHLEGCSMCENESKVYQSIKASLETRRKPIDPDILDALQRFGNNLVTDSSN